jgi:hypothetical protein
MNMKYRDFYDEIREIFQTIYARDDIYKIITEYQPQHNQILSLIEEIDKSQGKQHDNFRHRYLPKTLSFPETITHAVVTTTSRFVNENSKYKKELEELPKGSYIGYWTIVKKAIFYTKDKQSLGQFVVPKKGLLIPQVSQIEVIEKESIRQRRSDSKYHNLVEVDEIEIDDEVLPKKVWRKENSMI